VSFVNQSIGQQANGVSLTESLRGIVGMGGPPGASGGFFFMSASAGATLSFRPAARIENAQLPMWAHRGLITDSVGNVDSQIEVQVVTSGESTYDFLHVTLTPRQGPGWDMARALGDKPLGVVDVTAANGNQINPASSLEKVLPAKLVDPAPAPGTNPNAYKAG
jgi:hypothetical protein